VRVVEYDRSRLRDIADLMERVWAKRPDEHELEWFYGGNPIEPASVLLGEEDGRVVGSAAISFLRMFVGGKELKAGMPVHLATDPDYRRRGILAQLQAENESRARAAGARLLFVVPTPPSASVLRRRLGWTPLPPLRVWARPHLPVRHPRTRQVTRFEPQVTQGDKDGVGDRVLRDADWLNWRFAGAPRRYTLLANGGYAVLGRRGRLGVLAAAGGLRAAPGGAIAIAAPPPWERGRYLRAGWLPTAKTFTLLGKSLDPALALPARPHFELGDLDFF
jgi:GNAT superfamily N-acetyltransferase